MTTGATTTVTGTTTPGATVEVVLRSARLAGQHHRGGGDHGRRDRVTFSATVPTPSGSDVITAATSTGAHATGWAQATVTGGT